MLQSRISEEIFGLNTRLKRELVHRLRHAPNKMDRTVSSGNARNEGKNDEKGERRASKIM